MILYYERAEGAVSALKQRILRFCGGVWKPACCRWVGDSF